MENRALAHRYAKALLKMDPEGAVENEVALLHESFHRSRHVIMVFLDPMVHGSVKIAAVHKAFGAMSTKLKDFLAFVQAKNRVDHLPLIFAVYLSLRRKERGLLMGKVHSATPMSTEQVKHLESVVGQKLGKQCEFQASVDSRLIGGFSIHIEDTVYDCSVRSQLDRLRARFLNLAG